RGFGVRRRRGSPSGVVAVRRPGKPARPEGTRGPAHYSRAATPQVAPAPRGKYKGQGQKANEDGRPVSFCPFPFALTAMPDTVPPPSRELILLSPYRVPGQNALYLGNDDMAAFLNGYTALWHPAALRAAATPPR